MTELTKCQIDDCQYATDGGCLHPSYGLKWKLSGNYECFAFTKKEKDMEPDNCSNCAFKGVRKSRTRFSCKDGGDTRMGPCHSYEREGLNFTKDDQPILTFNGKRITHTDKVLSLAYIWNENPCSDEFDNMCEVYIDAGFRFTETIPFTQDNLDLLSDTAFDWLLHRGFFEEVKEEMFNLYKNGQWFQNGRNVYFIIQSADKTKYSLIYAGSSSIKPSFCIYEHAIPMEASTEEELSKLIAKWWINLSPISSPIS